MATLPKFSLLDYLEKHAPVICDGAKPLLLKELGFPETDACFMANMTHPTLVSQVYKTYLRAGAAILRTNTEGAHRLMLEALNLSDRGENLNNNGMALLREGAGMTGIPAGSVTSIKKDISGEIPKHLLEKAYGEQLIYQADTGARFIMLSEFEDEEDLKIAARVAKRSIQKQVVAHLRSSAYHENIDLIDKLKEVQQIADFVGIQAAWQQPNLPGLVQALIDQFGIISVLLDETTPLPFGEVSLEFTETVQKILSFGPAMIGGGHNTTPAHIQSIAEVIKALYEK